MTVENAKRLERDLLEIMDPPRTLDDRLRVGWHGVGVNDEGLPVCCLVVHDPGARSYGEHEFFVYELGPGAYEWAAEGPGRTIEEIFAGYRDEYSLVWTESTG